MNAFTQIAAQIAQATEQAAAAQPVVVETTKTPVVKAAKFGAEYGEQILHSYGCHAFERMVDGAVHFTIVRQDADDKGRKCNSKKFFQHMIERSKLFKVGTELIVTNFIDEKEMTNVENLFTSFNSAVEARRLLDELIALAINTSVPITNFIPSLDDMEETIDGIIALKKINVYQHYVIDGIMSEILEAKTEMNDE